MASARILWPTDFSETALEAFEAAAEQARRAGGELVVLHVIEKPAEAMYGERSKEGEDLSEWAIWKLARKEAEERLEALVGPRVQAGPAYRVVVHFGDAAERIAEVVREEGVQLVVIAARRERSLLRERLLGTTAYKIVRTVECDVLLVK